MPQEMTRESYHRALQIPANPTTTISAVGSLYPELLGWIFLFVAQDAYWMYHNYVPQTSHICSYWRSVALQTPRLWNKFYIDSSKFYTHPWTHECLKRTKSVLLDVVIMADDYFNPSKMHEVFPDLCRLESLEVDDGMGESNIDDIQDIFRPYDSTPNPNLRSLSIVCGTGKAYKLPFKLFRNDMPNLEFLVLCNCSLDDWNSLASFNSLTTLAIRGQDPMSLPSFGRLSLLPCLEWLSLDFLQASRSLKTELTPDIERSLLFPALQKLSLCVPTVRVASTYLAHLSVPVCSQLHLFCNSRTGTEQDYLSLLPILIRLLTTEASYLSQIPLHCLLLQDNRIVAGSWGSHVNRKCPSSRDPGALTDQATIDFHFLCPIGSVVSKSFLVTSIVSPLSHCFNVANVQSLSWVHVNSERDVELGLDNQFFCRAKGLRVVDIVTDHANFLDCILPDNLTEDREKRDGLDIHFHTAEFSAQSICPELRKLNITSPRYLSLPEARSLSHERLEGSFLNEVAEKLMKRKQLLRQALETLCINNFPKISISEKQRLEQVTQNLLID